MKKLTLAAALVLAVGATLSPVHAAGINLPCTSTAAGCPSRPCSTAIGCPKSVPEPSSPAILVSGLFALGSLLVLRRKQFL